MNKVDSFICHSSEMMGNAELVPEVDLKSMKPLLSQDVVDQLLHKYMATLQVRCHFSTILLLSTGAMYHSLSCMAPE